MDDKEMLKKVVNEISLLYESGSKTNESLKEFATFTLAIKNLLVEKGYFSEKEFNDKIEEIK